MTTDDTPTQELAQRELIPSQRHRFSIPPGHTYLNQAYLSPRLDTVVAAGHAAVDGPPDRIALDPSEFFEGSEHLRSLAAHVAAPSDPDPDAVALVPAVSYGIGVAAANVGLSEGQTVVVLAEQFPSHVYPWRARAAEVGADIVTCPRPADADWTAGVLDAITDQTAVVAVPHSHWTDGSYVDLAAVGRRAAEVGAALVVDATQAMGAHPFDCAEIGADFVVAAGYKWLLGPYSLGYLWTAPHRREGRPLEHNWITRQGSEDFARLVDYVDELQPGARRYDVGERSNFVLVPMATAALDQILDWGVHAIAETLGRLTGRLEDGARRLGLDPIPRERRVAHMLGIRFPDGVPDGLPEKLRQENISVSMRGSAMRVAPHLYTSEEDIDRLLAVLALALESS